MKLLLQGLGYPSDTEGKKPTLHGFRSTARVWAKKRHVPRDIAEAALSHDTGNEVELSYMRWDLLEPRARLNQFYADYATGKLEAAGCGSSRRFKRSLTRSAFGLMRLNAVRMRRRGGQKRRSAGWSGWKVSLPR